MGFLIWLFFIGILIAAAQDLRRREVDDWLNFFLFASGAGFLVFSAVFNWNYLIILFGIFSFMVLLVLSNLFYYGRIFGGGDSKLLLAMFPLFAGISLKECFSNIGLFVIFLLVCGSLWGLFYSLILISTRFSKFSSEFKNQFKNVYVRFGILAGIVLFVLSYVNILFLFSSLFVFLSVLLFAFAKAVDKSLMIKQIKSNALREGDWLVDDINVKGKTIKSNWEGITKRELYVLRKWRGKIKIKDGIPFVPSFFFALILYVFRDRVLELFFGFVMG